MERRPHLLFVDDERLLHDVFTRLFTRHGMKVTTCHNAAQAIEELKNNDFDLVVTDFMMPDMDGLELLGYIRQEYPQMKVIMITAHGSVQHAVRSMKSGAIDYIPKPFSTTVLLDRVQACLQKEEPAAAASGKASNRKARAHEARQVQFVGEYPSIVRIKEKLLLLSKNNAPVLIRGESGTGKEILARLVHQTSDRADGPFVALNCATLPRELVESHLFGHRKGAFTGATRDMTGAFEQADGGTLLLDEITEIDVRVQAKLLRVLQEQEIRRVGEVATKKINVRIIATSNRDLSQALSGGCLREDLYHRLSVFPLVVPPLRERASDIRLLAKHFVKKYAALYGLPQKRMAPEVMVYFLRQSWPGNVRSLENMVQRGVLLSADRDRIEWNDVFDDLFDDAEPAKRPKEKDLLGRVPTLEDMERLMILRALSESNNNRVIAAKRLGITDRTIRNKLRKYREEGMEV